MGPARKYNSIPNSPCKSPIGSLITTCYRISLSAKSEILLKLFYINSIADISLTCNSTAYRLALDP